MSASARARPGKAAILFLAGPSLLLLGANAAISQVSPTQSAAGPPPIAVPATSPGLVLREGTEVPMRTVRELSSLRNRQGDRFDLVVTENVMVDGHLVIPRGARGIGEITRLVPKGAWGKSGKLEARLLYVEVGAYRVRLAGYSSDRGKSGTAATVGTAVLAGVFSAFVTGTSATIPADTKLIGYVEKDVPLVLQPPPPTEAPLPIN